MDGQRGSGEWNDAAEAERFAAERTRVEASRPRSAWRRRVLMGASGTALAAGVGAGAFAAANAATSSTPSNTAASITASSSSGSSGSSGATTTLPSGSSGSSGTASPAPGGWGGPRGAGPMGGDGFAGAGMGGIHGTVTAVGSDGSITLTETGGTSITVKTDTSTLYELGHASGKATDVAVGDIVSIRPTTASASATSPTAAEVDIALPSMSGTVVSNDGSTIVITDSQGFQRTIHVTTSTKYTEAGSSTTAPAAAVGSTIVASGTVDANKTDLDASSVQIVLPRVIGTVTTVSGTSITITEPGGTSLTVTTDGSTTFKTGTTTGSIASVAKGDVIVAEGTKQSDGTFAAKSVGIGGAGVAGPGMDGPGGVGRGFGGPGF